MGTSLFDQGDPSAIQTMMGLLQQTPAAVQGAGPMPHITPQQMPQVAPPPNVTQPQQAPRLVDRIHHRLQGLLDAGRPSAPAGYEGLLTDEEIKQARPSFLSSLAGDAAQNEGGPSGAYQDRLDHLVKMHQLAAGIGEQKRVLAARQEMGQMFPAQPGETLDQTKQRIGGMYAWALQHGDIELVKDLGAHMTGIFGEGSGGQKDAQVLSNVMGTPGGKYAGKPVKQLLDPKTHAVVAEIPEAAPPMSPEAIAFRQMAAAQAASNAQALQSQRETTNAESQSRAFATQNKKLVDSVVPYQNAKNAFQEARAGNPAALKSAIIGFASVADPNAQLRQGVIQMISQVDPSVKGNFDLALARLGSGTLPPRIINDMERLVDRIHATNAASYDQRRKGAIARNKALDGYIPPADEVFTMPSSTPKGNGSETGGSGGSHTIVVNGKKFTVPN